MRNIGYNLLSSLHHFLKYYFLTSLSEFLIVQILLTEAKCLAGVLNLSFSKQSFQICTLRISFRYSPSPTLSPSDLKVTSRFYSNLHSKSIWLKHENIGKYLIQLKQLPNNTQHILSFKLK